MGIKELKRINPYFKILSTEPLVNMVPTFEATSEEVEKARNAHDNQYQTLDIICGKICQELGGDPSLIDVIGVNYYYNNQWVYKQSENSYLHWNNEDDDPRWRPLHSLIEEVYQRYQLPILLSETSHSGEDRGKWIRSIATQCQKISEMKIPFLGICLYPIIDRPDWDNGQWHHSGLWDCFPEDGISRQINQDYAIALLESQVQMKHNSLEKENIESRPLWKPMHLQPVFAGCGVVGGAVSEALFADGLCLPSGSNLLDSEIDEVIEIVRATVPARA